ncbi:MAG: twin-arginine translocase subunit TatC [Patescibacteria group bacterium]
MNENQNKINVFFPFLIEIRRRIITVFLVFSVAAVIGVVFYEKIVTLFISLLDLKGATIIFTSPFEYMNLSINSGVVVGVIVTLPLIIYQLVNFFEPAMTKKEFQTFKNVIPLSLILFVAGFAVGFIMMKYVGVLSYQTSLKLGISSYLNISSLLSTVLVTSSLMGIAFQFPIVLIFLIRFKIISYKLIAGKRPIAYILAIVFSSIMPPTDILSLILLTIPLVILYEIVLLFTKNYQ